MADNKGYEVTGVEELTVLRTVSSLPQADGSVLHQNGMGRTYLQGEVIPADMVAEDWKEALDSGEGPLYEALKDKLKPSSGEPSENIAQRLGLPFEGYDDMTLAFELIGYSADFLIDCYVILLDVPRTEREWARMRFSEPWDPDKEKYGLRDEQHGALRLPPSSVPSFCLTGSSTSSNRRSSGSRARSEM